MSYGRSRVAEFHGPEQLVEAGQTLLDEPKLDMAVVRQAADFETSGIDRQMIYPNGGPLGGPAQQWLEESLGLADLDEVVQSWWDTNPNESYSFEGRTDRVGSNIFDIARHLDGNTVAGERWYLGEGELPGPISLSLRIDPNHNHKRVFYARRIDEAPRHLQPIPVDVLRLVGRGIIGALPMPMSHVRQEPGDCILFPNYPLPAVHQVKTKVVVGPHISVEREAQSLVHHYFVKPIKVDAS